MLKPQLVELPLFKDERGALVVIEALKQVPFEIARVFFCYGMKGERGGHAHKALLQFVLAVAGGVGLKVDNGREVYEFYLDTPSRGVLIPPLHWVVVDKWTEDAVCMVVASDFYDEADYLREYAQFLDAVAPRWGQGGQYA